MQSITAINKKDDKSSSQKSKHVHNSLAIKTPVLHKPDPADILKRAYAKPDSLTHDDIMVLQNTIGNRAVIKLLSGVKGKGEARKEEKEGSPKPHTSNQKVSQGTVKVGTAATTQLKKGETPNSLRQSTNVSTQKNSHNQNTGSKKAEVKEAGGSVKKVPQHAGTHENEHPKAISVQKTPLIEGKLKKPDNKQISAVPHKEDKEPQNVKTHVQTTNNPAKSKSSSHGAAAGYEGNTKASTPVQTVKIKAENPGKILEQLGSVPPAQIYNAFSQAEAVSGAALEKQMHKAQAVIPAVPVPTGLKPGKQPDSQRNKITPINHKAQEGFKSEKPGGKAYEGTLHDFNASSGTDEEANPEAIMAEAREYSSNAPSINMEGEADPSQVAGFKAEAANKVRSAQKAELNQTHADFGEHHIVPKPDNTIIKAQKSVRAVTPPSVDVQHMDVIPPDVAARMNPSLAPILKGRLEGKKNEYNKGKAKFDSDVIAAKNGTLSDIEHMKSEARQEQQNEQAEAKAQVNSLRSEWRSEINGAVADYDHKANSASEDKKREIGSVKKEKETQVHKTMSHAEKEANTEYKAAKSKAEDKKKDKEKDGGGVFGWIKEKAQQLVDGIKKAISSIFDGLRKAVKFIFDKAKQAAMNIIEAGRKLIVNIIKGLGQVLKGLVKTVFAKFPGIANRICSKIDQAVNRAVKAVNHSAALLKKGVSKALDFLVKSVDKVVAGVQSLYNGIFSAIGKFLKSDFKTIFGKILEGAQIAAEIAAAFATGGGSILLQIGIWLGKTLPELFNKVSSVIGFVNNLRSMKLDDVKQFLMPGKIGDFMVRGLFGELKGLPQAGNEGKEKEEEPKGEGRGLLKVFQIISGVFKILKGVYGKVAGGINKILPAINISTKSWFNPFAAVYAGASKALEVVKNPGEALNEGADKVKEAIGEFFKSIKSKLGEVAGGIKAKVALIGQPAQLMKLLANKAVDMVLNFIITHPPSALIKAAFKAVEAVAGKSIIELVRQHIPFADKLINKIAESGPVQGLMKPLEQPVKQVGGMIDEVSGRAVGMVEDSEQKAVGVFGNGTKVLQGLTGAAGGKKAANPGAGQKSGGGGDFLGGIKSGIHTRLLSLGQKLLQSGKVFLKGAADKVKGMILGQKLKFKLGTESHELWVQKRGSKRVVMMASGEGKELNEIIDKTGVKNVELKKDIQYAESIKDDTKNDPKPLEEIRDDLKKTFPEGVEGKSGGASQTKKKTKKSEHVYREKVDDALSVIRQKNVPKDITFEKLLEDYQGRAKGKFSREVLAYAYYEYTGKMDQLDDINYRRILKDDKREITQEGYHAHHILYKQGLPGTVREKAMEGRRLLQKYSIDPVTDPGNLVGAPNKGHSEKNIMDVVNALVTAEKNALQDCEDLGIVEKEEVKKEVRKALIKALQDKGKDAAAR